MKAKVAVALLVLATFGAVVAGRAWMKDDPSPAASARRAAGKGEAAPRGSASGHDEHKAPAAGEPGSPGGQAAPPQAKGAEGGPPAGQPAPPAPGQQAAGAPPPAPEVGAEPARAPGRDYVTTTEGDPNSYFMEASDQESDGRSMVIRKVIIRGSGGYVAIHPQEGEPWPVFASSGFLPEGEHNNVVIRWSRGFAGDVTLFPMLHLEDNNNTAFNFPDGDYAPKINGAFIVFPVKLYVG